MFNPKTVEESDEQILMRFEQPYLENVFRHPVAALQLHRFHQPINLGIDRLALDEHRTEAALLSQGDHHPFVNVPMRLPQAAEYVFGQWIGDGLEQLVGSHGGRIRGSSNGRHETALPSARQPLFQGRL
jgi:hypothetical protein